MKHAWINRTSKLLFPPLCVFCSTPCEAVPCCRRCVRLLPLNRKACARCAVPLVPGAGGVCAACQQSPPPFVSAVAALKYEFPVDMAIKSMKFRRNLFYLPVFGEIVYRALKSSTIEADCLAPVPLHRWRQAQRGFNQALELANYVSRRSGLPIMRNILRARATKTQSGLTAEERRKNLQNAFRVRGRLQGRRPLIVDDVMTTGETCGQLAGVLLAADAEQVSVLTLARAPHGDD